MPITVPRGTIIVVAPECISGQRLLEAAQATGCRVVVAVTVPPQQDENLRWHLVCNPEHLGTCDRLIWRATYEELVADLSDETSVVAVIPGSEFGVETAEKLAAHFGVRGNLPGTSSLRRNKFAMKQALRAAGLGHAKGRYVTTIDEAVAFARCELKYPIVTKPPDGAAALNVFVVANEIELIRALAHVLETPDGYGKIPHAALVEEFIPGEEYAVNLFGDKDKLVVTSIWRYEWNATPFADRIYWNEFLQDLNDPQFAELCAYAKRLYRAVGIRLGPAHAEIKLSPRGPVAMEIGARLMGGANETFAEAGMCLDVPAETVKVFTTGTSDMPAYPCLHERLAYATLPYVTGGVVTAIRGLNAIRALPTYYREEMPLKVGDTIRPSRYLDECACGVWLKASTESELMRDLTRVHEVFHVEVS